MTNSLNEQNPKFTIRSKFLLLLSGLLFLCIASYLALTLHTFKQDKTALVFDLNRYLVTSLNSELDHRISATKDKLELFALGTEGHIQHSQNFVENIFKNDNDLIYISATNRAVRSGRNVLQKPEFLQTYSLPDSFFESALSNDKIPLDRILQTGLAIWRINEPNAPPLLGIGKAVIVEAADHTPIAQYAVIGVLKIDGILKSISQLNINQIFVTDNRGNLLIIGENTSTASSAGKTIGGFQELVQNAIKSENSSEVFSYEHEGQSWLTAFAKTKKTDVISFALISEQDAFSAITAFIKRSLLMTGIVATLAFIVAILFSRTLTRPLEILVLGMRKVTAGELETRIEVKSHDETAILASSFNKMISELQDSRIQLEGMNRDLEQKVKDRTVELEDRNRAVKEAQEALLRTTRLASVGEIAARAAHEVLNPLTGIMTRINLVQKRSVAQPSSNMQLFSDILTAWQKDYQRGGLDALMTEWKKPSSINPEVNLFTEDLENLQAVQKSAAQSESQIQEDTQFLLDETQRISTIIQKMRSLSQVQSQRQRHDLHKVINDAIKITSDLFNQANIQVETNFVQQNVIVNIDRDEFIQSLTNLFRNSIQSIRQSNRQPGPQPRPEKCWLHIGTASVDGNVHIDVQDNGGGISAEHQKHLFEAQFTTKNKDEGTGLGLSISRRFMRAVDGDLVLLHSELGVGTCFRITLPLPSQGKSRISA